MLIPLKIVFLISLAVIISFGRNTEDEKGTNHGALRD